MLLDWQPRFTIREKGRNDLVTEADVAAQEVIHAYFARRFPTHAFLGEENRAGATLRRDSTGRPTWIVDPLDGTTNYAHGIPVFAVSIGLEVAGELVVGVIYDPSRNDLFTSTRGRGAFLNETRIRVSKRIQMKPSLIGTGFPFRQLEHVDAYLAMLRDVMHNSAGVRRAGAAALDLAYVAGGRLDAFWEIGLSKWDMAAGALLITEAGGLVGDLEGNPGYLDSGNILAGNPKIFGLMVQLLARHLTPPLRSRTLVIPVKTGIQ